MFGLSQLFTNRTYGATSVQQAPAARPTAEHTAAVPAGSSDASFLSPEAQQSEESLNPSFLDSLTNWLGGLGSGSGSSSHIAEALGGDGQGTFINGNGQEVSFGLRQSEGTGSHESYSMSIGDDQLAVNISNGLDSEEALERIADLYSQQPEEWRHVVDTINVEAGRSPDDARWAQERGQPNFRAAASGGGGAINFYGGLRNLKEDTFNHEFGHNLGGHVRETQDQESREAGRLAHDRQADLLTGDATSPNIPRGYSEAVQADGRSVSSYGDTSFSEDFAEFYDAYRAAEERGPQALARLEERYGQRYEFLMSEVFGLAAA
jgi:hypothetical protein